MLKHIPLPTDASTASHSSGSGLHPQWGPSFVGHGHNKAAFTPWGFTRTACNRLGLPPVNVIKGQCLPHAGTQPHNHKAMPLSQLVPTYIGVIGLGTGAQRGHPEQHGTARVAVGERKENLLVTPRQAAATS